MSRIFGNQEDNMLIPFTPGLDSILNMRILQGVKGPIVEAKPAPFQKLIDGPGKNTGRLLFLIPPDSLLRESRPLAEVQSRCQGHSRAGIPYS